MSASVENRHVITYGASSWGGTEDALIDGPVRHRRTERGVTVAFDLVLTTPSGDDDDLTAAGIALEDVVSTPHQRLTVVTNGVTWIDWDPAGADSSRCVGIQGEADKAGDEDTDTGLTRRYEVSFDVERAADRSGFAGRRDQVVSVDYTPARLRRVVISGQYTALTSKLAREQYEDEIDTWQQAVLDGVDDAAVWELIPEESFEEPLGVDTGALGHVLSYRRTFDEVRYDQGDASVDDPLLVRPELAVSLETPAEQLGAFGADVATPLQRMSIEYSAWVRVNEGDVPSTDQDIYEYYTETVRPWLLARAEVVGSSAGALVITSESVRVTPIDRRLLVRIDAQVSAGNTFEITYSLRQDGEPPDKLVPAHGGDPFAQYRFSGSASLTMTASLERVVRASGVDQVAFEPWRGRELAAGGFTSPAGEQGEWVRQPGGTIEATPFRVGQTGQQIQLVRQRQVGVWRLRTTPRSREHSTTGSPLAAGFNPSVGEP